MDPRPLGTKRSGADQSLAEYRLPSFEEDAREEHHKKRENTTGRSTTASNTHKWATGKADRTRMIDFPAFCSVALPAAVYRTQTKEKHGKITYSLAEAIFYS